MPSWIETRRFTTHPREGGARHVDFPLVNWSRRVLWMVQMHCIDMNAWYSRVDNPGRPDYVVFDLDPPDEPGGFALAIEVAHLVRELLDELELPGYVKTSGADGIHVLAPIQRRAGFDDTYAFAEGRGRLLEERHPGKVTTEWLKKKRVGRAARPPPERLGQDDRLGLLGPSQAGRAGLDAAPLGRADAGRAAARLHDGGGAGAGRAARRPVRAGARGGRVRSARRRSGSRA